VKRNREKRGGSEELGDNHDNMKEDEEKMKGERIRVGEGLKFFL